MKLSEILEWENPKCHCGLTYCECIINNYTACDREIDREALAQLLYKLDNPDRSGITIQLGAETGDRKWFEDKYYPKADVIISTMPTWLKRVKE